MVVEPSENGAEAYDGTHFAYFLGVEDSTASLSQDLNSVVAGEEYILSYYYEVALVGEPVLEDSGAIGTCTLEVSIGGTIVDTVTSPSQSTPAYIHRTASYTPVGSTENLQFLYTCKLFIPTTTQYRLALDEITLTTSGTEDGCDAK